MHLPYLSLHTEVLPAAAIKRLQLYLPRRLSLIEDSPESTTGKSYGLSNVNRALGVISQEIAQLRQRLTVPFKPMLVAIGPGVSIAPHRDALVYGRNCSIMVPIWPLDSYSPLLFWEDQGDVLPEHKVGADEMPILANLQHLHSVRNHATWRFNFQLSIDLPFAQLAELHTAGRLLRPVQAGPGAQHTVPCTDQ